MEVANAYSQEARSLFLVQRGDRVSCLRVDISPTQLFEFILCPRICVMTGLRINAAMALNAKNLTSAEDLTYNVSKVAVLTCLESLLGIFDACLPVCRPILQRIFRFDRCGMARTSNKGISCTAADNRRTRLYRRNNSLPNGYGYQKSSFQPLDGHEYPLERMEEIASKVSVSTNVPKYQESADARPRNPQADIKTPHGGIRVTKEWNISTTQAT